MSGKCGGMRSVAFLSQTLPLVHVTILLRFSVHEVLSPVPSPCCLDQLDVGHVFGSVREFHVVYCTLVLKYLHSPRTDICNSYIQQHTKRGHSVTTNLPGRPSLLGCGSQRSPRGLVSCGCCVRDTPAWKSGGDGCRLKPLRQIPVPKRPS